MPENTRTKGDLAVRSRRRLKVGDFAIDPHDLSITKNGSITRVEPKIMDVLMVLCDNAGEVVSRDVLLDEVWGVRYGSDGSLTRAISCLRKCFADVDDCKPIQTFSKRGYRLNLPVEALDTEPAPIDAAVPVIAQGGQPGPFDVSGFLRRPLGRLFARRGRAVGVAFGVLTVAASAFVVTSLGTPTSLQSYEGWTMFPQKPAWEPISNQQEDAAVSAEVRMVDGTLYLELSITSGGDQSKLVQPMAKEGPVVTNAELEIATGMTNEALSCLLKATMEASSSLSARERDAWLSRCSASAVSHPAGSHARNATHFDSVQPTHFVQTSADSEAHNEDCDERDTASTRTRRPVAVGAARRGHATSAGDGSRPLSKAATLLALLGVSHLLN